MSTRACIRLKKKEFEDCYYYQHFDGYPTGLLVDIIHDLKNINTYEDVKNYLENTYRETNRYPSDIDFSYVIDIDEGKIYTYHNKETHLLRIDPIDVGEIELEHKMIVKF